MTHDMQQRLEDMRRTFNTQKQQIEDMRGELRQLGLEEKQPDLDKLSPEERDQLFAIERELRTITEALQADEPQTIYPRTLHNLA